MYYVVSKRGGEIKKKESCKSVLFGRRCSGSRCSI